MKNETKVEVSNKSNDINLAKISVLIMIAMKKIASLKAKCRKYAKGHKLCVIRIR